MTITSIGYGDVAATAGNAVEIAIATVLMMAGSLLWAQVLASFVTILTSHNSEALEFRNTLDGLNSFMSREALPATLRLRLREYFHQTKHLSVTRRDKNLLHMMSPDASGEQR